MGRTYLAMVCILAICSAAAIGDTESDRPNVLLIAIDDLNDWTGCLGGHPDTKTPNIDRIAARGTLFTNAHCQYPICGPSRASFMTGLYPTTLGYTNHMGDRQLEQRAGELGTKLLHTYLKTHGYKAMAVGKICHHHVPRDSVDASGGRGSFGPKLRKVWQQQGTSTDWGVHPDRDEEMPDYQAAMWAIDRLGEKHNQPFILMVGFLRPHVPWYVPQKWFDRIGDPAKLRMPPYRKDDLNDLPEMARQISILPQMPRTEWAIENNQWQHIIHAYLASITFTDHYVGRVLDALDRSDYRDNTIIVVLSDHGYHLGEKNTFQKHSLWQRSSHVPLIIAGPNLPRDQKSARTVGLIDLYPTILELCDLPANPKVEGRSLAPLLRGPDRPWDHPAITSWKDGNHAVQTERYRYIRYSDGSRELYDHQADPNEWENLASDPKNDRLMQQFDQELEPVRRPVADPQ